MTTIPAFAAWTLSKYGPPDHAVPLFILIYSPYLILFGWTAWETWKNRS